jgi:hypothetical protein
MGGMKRKGETYILDRTVDPRRTGVDECPRLVPGFGVDGSVEGYGGRVHLHISTARKRDSKIERLACFLFGTQWS